ncbi:GNAT family N-acetyltransferase [Beduini massiliensis]|uniref:GNAT family N-acetyltransferase n=2 Tax=Beduini massiliensis TaxID=1585974 RepID=UPI00164D9A94|nr:GNAT family N-acetyltransferase [Beduini massiliensis]
MKMALNHTGTIELISDRLCLRPFSLEDTFAFHEYITSNNKVRRYFLIPYHQDIFETKKMMTQMIKAYRSKTYNWAVTLKEGNEWIGLIRLFDVNDDHASAEIGYALSPHHWNNGYMSEAISTVLNHLFVTVGYQRLTADCMSENQASCRVLEKNGMQLIGKTMNGIFWQECSHDVLHYSLSRDTYLTK